MRVDALGNAAGTSDQAMNALAQSAPTSPQPAAVPLLRTLVLCDLVDSTSLVQHLGDQNAAELFRKHDRLARALLGVHGGREIDKTDGFLLMFDRPVQAVAFALAYQRALLQLGADEHIALAARVGIHVGDILTWDNAPDDIAKGAKRVEVEGLVKPIASRLMQLALPNQILLSGVAYALAHRSQGELGAQLDAVRWRTHGRYRFKGIPDPIAVFEVGEEKLAPLRAPPWSGKAHRETPLWRRPASMLFEGLALLALLAIPAWYAFKPAPAIAFANRDWVVVGDLKNLTGDAAFDDSIDTAFRIGLEQSRYVNVLSNLKTRETVQLMQKDPDKTAIDRAVGSEVAIRDGARALILPTIAEIGGRVRVTAEVVDPNTQTTVWSESADGAGAASVLPSLDTVNQKLRVRLGEALATVSSESKPLEKVATKNLDALHAYSLGHAAYSTGRMKDALPLFQQAAKLDPDFALAYLWIGEVHFNANELGEFKAALDKASLLRDHLSPRDALYVDAELAGFESPRAGLEKWKLLASLYPDFFPASGRHAYLAWLLNQYAGAIESAKKSASDRNTHRATSDYLLGILYLAQEQHADAKRAFSAAAAEGFGRTEYAASALASQRQFDQASATLARGKLSGRVADDIDVHVPRIAFAVDQGHWQQTWSALATAKRDAATIGPSVERWFTGMEQGLRVLTGTTNDGALEKYLDVETSALAGADNAGDRAQARFHIVFAGYLAARHGDTKLATAALTAAGHEARSADDPMLAQLTTIADVEIARASGHAGDALAKLKAQLDGSELCLTHVALMDAYAASGENAAALAEARWLAAHRGRAYAEYGAHQYLTAFNVAQSDLALLRASELALALGGKDEARKALDQFRQTWPQAELPAALMLRVNAVATTL